MKQVPFTSRWPTANTTIDTMKEDGKQYKANQCSSRQKETNQRLPQNGENDKTVVSKNVCEETLIESKRNQNMTMKNDWEGESVGSTYKDCKNTHGLREEKSLEAPTERNSSIKEGSPRRNAIIITSESSKERIVETLKISAAFTQMKEHGFL